MPTKTWQSLETLLGKAKLITDPAELITYELDAGLDRGTPDAVAFPQTPKQVAHLVRWASEQDLPVVARGAGTGLSGGAVAERGGLIVEFSRMNRVFELDPRGRSALVEPGVLNLALDELAKQYGLYFPPDPSSQRASTLGGNVAENAGGPHCFKYGVTTNYVTGMLVVLANGRAVRLGGRAFDYPEYDLSGLIVGSEGTLAIITAIHLRLVRNPPGVKTMMAIFDSVEQAGAAVSAVIAAGLVPATMELLDRNFTRIIEEHAHAGLPTDAGAMCILEADGYPASLETQIAQAAGILREYGARELRIAQNAEEREKIWYARKSAAGALARLTPSYYMIDISVPRSRLAETIAEANQICAQHQVPVAYTLHAGDGNLHPVLLIMHPDDEQLAQAVHHAAREIVELGIRKGGSITGEHGVGIEKRAYMALMHNEAELAAMRDIKQVFDPDNRLNPGKIFPQSNLSTRSGQALEGTGDGRNSWPGPRLQRNQNADPRDLYTPATVDQAARLVAGLSDSRQRVCIAGRGARPSGSTPPLLSTERLRGIKVYAPQDLYVTVGAGTRLMDVQSFLVRDRMQVPLVSPWEDATIGGIVACNINAPLRMRYGSIRDLVLAMIVVLADGRVIRAGRPVVKNVAGYDLPKVFVGSHGALGLITDVTLRLTPLPRVRRTLRIPADDLTRAIEYAARLLPLALVASAIVWDGKQLVYTAEGFAEDVEGELDEVRAALRAGGAPEAVETDGPTGTDLWARLVGGSDESTLQVRAGVAPRDLADYLRASMVQLTPGAFLADVAAGLVHVKAKPASIGAARAWLDALRQPALDCGGYAVVTSAPEALHNALDSWGYRPETLELMRDLKARWDPASILHSEFFAALNS